MFKDDLAEGDYYSVCTEAAKTSVWLSQGQDIWTRIKRPNPVWRFVPYTDGWGWVTSLLACRALEGPSSPLAFFFFGCASSVCGTVPQSGFEPRPLQWKHGNLTTGLQGNSCPIASLIAHKDEPSQGGPVRSILSPQHLGGYWQYTGLPWCSVSKESVCSAGDLDLIPGLGRSPGGGHGNPLSKSCLENPMNRGAWQATVHRVTKSQTRLSD